MTSQIVKLNPFFRIRFEAPLRCDLLLDGATVELQQARYVELLVGLAQGADIAEAERVAMRIFGITAGEAAEVVEDLLREKILVKAPVEEGYPEVVAVKHWEDRGWLDALALHTLSRDLVFQDDQAEQPEVVHDQLLSRVVGRDPPSSFWKDHPGKEHIGLPALSDLQEKETLPQVLLRRRSNQPWKHGPVSLAELSEILRVGNHESRRLRMEAEAEWSSRPGVLMRSAFCALETYVFAFNVEALLPGLYHYDPRDASLVALRKGLLRKDMASMCAGQPRPGESACVFAITAVWQRYMYRYRHPRAYRTLLINVAELAQKYITVATALHMSTFLTPLFQDDVADALLGVDGHEESVLEVVAIG